METLWGLLTMYQWVIQMGICIVCIINIIQASDGHSKAGWVIAAFGWFFVTIDSLGKFFK
jgi:hypothetical protein